MEEQNSAEIAIVILQALNQHYSQHKHPENPSPHASWTQNDIGSAIYHIQQDISELKMQMKQQQQLAEETNGISHLNTERVGVVMKRMLQLGENILRPSFRQFSKKIATQVPSYSESTGIPTDTQHPGVRNNSRLL